MGRPLKEGLGYFSFEVGIFEDSKIEELTLKFGPVGEVIYFRLLCLIYKEEGYYFKFESIEQLSRKLIKSIGNRWIRDEKIVAQVIPFLAKINLFSAELMQENVLTSTGVQKRYQKATGRRQSRYKKYWLLNDENDEPTVDVAEIGINDNNNKVSVYNNSINDRIKNTESKANMSDINKNKYIDIPAVEQELISRLMSNKHGEFYDMKISGQWGEKYRQILKVESEYLFKIRNGTYEGTTVSDKFLKAEEIETILTKITVDDYTNIVNELFARGEQIKNKDGYIITRLLQRGMERGNC